MKDHRESEIEKLISHRSWRRYTALQEGPHGRSRQVQAHAFSRVREGSVSRVPGVKLG